MSAADVAEQPQLSPANWLEPEVVRRSFQQVETFLPTVSVSRGDEPPVSWPGETHDVVDLEVSPALGTVREVLNVTETDGCLVLQDGRLVLEEYFGTMTPSTRHLLMSVSKSLVGVVAGALVDRSVLDPTRLVTDYVPELAGSGYDGALVRDVLDMRSGVRFSEDYLDPHSEVSLLDQAVGWAPATPAGPRTLKDFLVRTVADGPHGGAFRYRSCETNALGWVCESASGRPFGDLASELVWSRLGTEADATICVDPDGTPVFDGGVNATLRDLARFGTLLLDDGSSPTGEAVVSRAWIDDMFTPGAKVAAAFAAGPHADLLPGGAYRSQCWIPAGSQTLLCIGIHGQLVYVDRSSRLVGVKLSSWPVPLDEPRMAATLQMFAAISDHLRR